MRGAKWCSAPNHLRLSDIRCHKLYPRCKRPHLPVMTQIASLLFAASATFSTSLSASLGGQYDNETLWKLQSIDGAAFTERATLMFPAPAQISGATPCNSYFGVQTSPTPGFNASGLGITQRLCPGFAKEAEFITALRSMTKSEFRGNMLILSNESGREMIFVGTSVKKN